MIFACDAVDARSCILRILHVQAELCKQCILQLAYEHKVQTGLVLNGLNLVHFTKSDG